MEIITLNTAALIKVFGLAAISFLLAFIWTPILANLLYKYKVWKKTKKIGAPVMSRLHHRKENTPTMGGLLVWVTVFVITMILNLSRSQTWLPLFALVTTGVLGAIDDLINIKGQGGMKARYKLIWLIAIAALGAWWFYSKLDYHSIHIPAVGDFAIGLWYIPLFIFVIIATANSVNITDGLDGLAGGLLAMAYLAFGIIAFAGGQFGLAGFCATIAGALLAFLWFNIYPARFFMGDTGSMALGATLGVVAMLTNSVLVLPIIGFVFVMETLSVIIQRCYKGLHGGKKLFHSTPIHHHFEALGWPETKVTMRFWVIGAVVAVIGLVIGLIGRGVF
jgi:phospho-N-acetylmuramoyl-pentapeptide-transferase